MAKLIIFFCSKCVFIKIIWIHELSAYKAWWVFVDLQKIFLNYLYELRKYKKKYEKRW